LVDWPRELVLIYDGDCGICTRTKNLWEKLDLDRAFQCAPLQSGIGARWRIPKEALVEQIYLIAGRRIESGFRAAKAMLLFNPVTYFFMLALIAALPANAVLYRRIVVALTLAFFLPPFEILGNAAYRWVARNRYRLSSGGACALDPKQ
jgi:predicted DCC family thiol-disulfide oxidoreductase YuxK